MPWVAAVGSVVGGLISSDASQNAAATQAASGQAAIASQQQAAAQQQALLQPYNQGGMQALQQLLSGTAPGGQFATPFKMEDSQAQQYATKSALSAMQNQMAAGGQGLSTNAIVGAGQTAANIGSQYEQQAYNQWLTSQQQALDPLKYLSSLGQASAAGSAANIGNTAANVSNLQTGIGNAQAAGQVGAANAYSGAANNVSQYLLMQSMMNNGGGGGGSGGSGGTAGTGLSGFYDNANLGYPASTQNQAYTSVATP